MARHSWHYKLGSSRVGHHRMHGNYVGKNVPRSKRSFNYFVLKSRKSKRYPNNSPGDV